MADFVATVALALGIVFGVVVAIAAFRALAGEMSFLSAIVAALFLLLCINTTKPVLQSRAMCPKPPHW